jgi:hypothetical protein
MDYSSPSEILKVYPNIYGLISDINKNDWWDRDEDAVLAHFKNDKKFIKKMRAEKIKLVLGDTDVLTEREVLKEFILSMFKIMER